VPKWVGRVGRSFSIVKLKNTLFVGIRISELWVRVADDVNRAGGNLDTIMKNTKALLDASRKVGLEGMYRKLSIC
jgi:hypothetical protein